MKTNIILFIALIFSTNVIMSQSKDHIEGGDYLKTVEYNLIISGEKEEYNMYNLEHKSFIDRLFFGTKNSFVEFVFEGSPEGSNEATAFRIIKNLQDDSYKLEIMRFQNIHKLYNIRDLLLEKTTPLKIPYWISAAVSFEIRDRIKEHNKQIAILKNRDDLYKPHRPKPKEFELSKAFAEKLHGKTAALIDNFKGVGIPPMIVDGNSVTFRCISADELWTLSIHCPQRRALQLSELFRQIIADGLDNKLDESKFIKQLDERDWEKIF